MQSKVFRILFSFIAAGIILLLYFFYDPRPSKSLFPKCIFHSLTGYHCPGCGTQRAFHAIIHGNIVSALSYNLLFVLLLPVIIYFLLYFIINNKRSKAPFIYKKYFAYFILSIVLAFWVLRNLPFYPFSWLAP